MPILEHGSLYQKEGQNLALGIIQWASNDLWVFKNNLASKDQEEEMAYLLNLILPMWSL